MYEVCVHIVSIHSEGLAVRAAEVWQESLSHHLHS